MAATIHPDARVALLSVTSTRPPNVPRLVIFHTNAGGSSSDGVATRRWIEAQLSIKKTPTQPHHQVDLDGTIWQFLPYDRKGVASAAAEGFCISVETQDYGTAGGWSIELQPWTDEQIESLASIAAFAHVEWGVPLRRPVAWDEAGVGTHSMWGVNTASNMSINPWTRTAGKACPGAARKAQLDRIIARARELVPPSPEVLMTDYLARLSDGQLVEKVGGVVRPVSAQETAPGGPLAGVPQWAVPADSDALGYANSWLAAAARAYAKSVGMA